MPVPRNNKPFGPLADPLVAIITVALWFVLLLRFRLAPDFDLAVSHWFFDETACAATQQAKWCSGFPYGVVPALSFIRELMHPIPVMIGIVISVMLAVELWMGKRWNQAGIRVKAVLVSALVVGPGLIVNGILKAHWGRPRPWMTEDFGGWLSFVEAGTKSDLCAANCSFVSGEAAAAGWLMCLALLLAVRRYVWTALAVGLMSIVMAGLRITFGAHYLSDVVLGYTMTIAIFLVLAALSELSVRRGR